jgi:hypothetical protein
MFTFLCLSQEDIIHAESEEDDEDTNAHAR